MFVPATRRRQEPSATFHLQQNRVDFSVVDFWSWAFSDLQDNTTRGILAEFIVARALGIELGVRSAWGDFDLVTKLGTRIEVKATGYLQSWKQKSLSTPTFTGLRARSWTEEGGLAEQESFRADVYVFCLQTSRQHDEYDPLDLAQWEFRVAPRTAVAALDRTNLGLAKVKAICPRPLSFGGLGTAVELAVRR